MRMIAECGYFIQWSTSWQTAPCHQMSGHSVISSISSSWPKPDMEISKFHSTRKKWPSMTILHSNLLHGIVHHPSKFQADSWNPQRVRVATLSLRPGPSLLSKFCGTCKNWLSMAILYSYLLHHTVHHSTTFQANSWNPERVIAVTSSLRPGPSL